MLVAQTEADIIKIYNSLTPVIQLANGGQMLNRGYWDRDVKNPLQAQHQISRFLAVDTAQHFKSIKVRLVIFFH